MYDPAEMAIGERAEGEHDRMPPQYAKTQEEAPDFEMYKEAGGHGLHGFHSHLHDPEALRKDMAVYYGMVGLMDREIGRILDTLDRLGIAEETLVLFTTDHGHFIGHHGLVAKGAFHYDDLLRIPMCARWPGVIPAGAVSDALQSQADFAPTFLAACGIEVPGQMQGVDQLPVWSGKVPAARDWTLVENRHNPTTVHLRTYITDRYKMTVYRDKPWGELFDLEADPQEQRNLWDEPEAAAAKAQLLHEFVQAEIQREPTRMPRIAGA
jgi:uncharacterized sulfatase